MSATRRDALKAAVMGAAATSLSLLPAPLANAIAPPEEGSTPEGKPIETQQSRQAPFLISVWTPESPLNHVDFVRSIMENKDARLLELHAKCADIPRPLTFVPSSLDTFYTNKWRRGKVTFVVVCWDLESKVTRQPPITPPGLSALYQQPMWIMRIHLDDFREEEGSLEEFLRANCSSSRILRVQTSTDENMETSAMLSIWDGWNVDELIQYVKALEPSVLLLQMEGFELLTALLGPSSVPKPLAKKPTPIWLCSWKPGRCEHTMDRD